MDALIDELLRFGKTIHDDIADALAYILDVVVFPENVPQQKILDDRHKTQEELEKEYWEQMVGEAGSQSNLLGEID
jgi:hypothetical protein